MSKKGISSEPIYYGLEKASKNRFWKIYSIILSVILLLVIAGGTVYLIFRPLTPAEVIDRNISAVVAIETHTYGDSNVLIGTGSGFIVDAAGYIVTNEHVVDDGGSITVYTRDGKSYSARIVEADDYYDIAVLKIFSEEKNYRFPTVKLGRAEDLTVGERVVAIGTPQERAYAWTSTVGHVSSSIRNFLEGGSTTAKQYVQFDAAVNGGNSGGPLFDSHGRVVGIVEKKVVDNEGMGLAIPIETVVDLIGSYIASDRGKAQLGVVGTSVEGGTEYFKRGDKIYAVGRSDDGETRYIVEDFNVIEFTDEIEAEGFVFTAEATGFKAWSITEGTGAYGVIKENDLIVGFDGLELTYDTSSPYDKIMAILNTKKAGDVVEVKLMRDGEIITVNITLTARK